ncbi:transposase, IS605 OrfB family, central region [Natronoarchaeum philippinense]|uniref:Transposase, IS605 OrfB family, central region n=1 Tax=Natronoarchaeum philippinense TaxID=558529 RepID=A0A285NSU5_NATPI|nr:RNA-guided endonuclease TnpB family protein [Natronoarchaeum philippinense]SNZ12519.1 transposase, IS605 OrfB family, central region [Natronoarchaeum philippinense]
MVEDSSTRTVPIKLNVDKSAADLLHQTTDHFLDAANYVVDVAWGPDWKITSKQKLHDQTYYDVRDHSPLPANLVQAARNRAAEAVKGVVERWKEGKKASKPHFTSRFASYDARTITVNDDHATLATIDGRVTAEFVLPNEQRDTPHSAYLLNDDYAVKGATLHYDTVEGCFYLHVRTKPAVENDDAEQGDAKHVSVLGVDLGITNIATTSTGRFWSGGELNHWHREYENRRGDLQQTGTRWAHEDVQRVGRKQTERFEQMLHTISNELVEEALENDCTHIVFEQLKGIRERLPSAKSVHKWAFHRLYEYVTYKAESVGLVVKQINPEYTSQRCSKCGFTHENNRPHNNGQDEFGCLKCGYDVHADYNASKNIGLKYLRDQQKSGRGGAPVGVRLNSGTLNVNGEYSPTPLSG